MIKINDIKKNYQNFNLDCSFEVPEGCITGLIGRNGAGKSTVFKSILGLIKLNGGEVLVFDKPVLQLSNSEREDIGVVLADSEFSGYLTIKDVAGIMDGMYKNFKKEDFINQCHRFELPTNKKIKEFSTGMKRKLQIIAAMSHNAKLLLLDEPTAGLDVVAREELLDMIREYMEQGERTILISSHISSDLEGLCDNLYLIDHGKILLSEETDVLLDQYAIIKLTKEQYEKMDKEYLMRCKEEKFGISCLTNQRQFYEENYPDVVVEKGNIDDVIMLMTLGKEC